MFASFPLLGQIPKINDPVKTEDSFGLTVSKVSGHDPMSQACGKVAYRAGRKHRETLPTSWQLGDKEEERLRSQSPFHSLTRRDLPSPRGPTPRDSASSH